VGGGKNRGRFRAPRTYERRGLGGEEEYFQHIASKESQTTLIRHRNRNTGLRKGADRGGSKRDHKKRLNSGQNLQLLGDCATIHISGGRKKLKKRENKKLSKRDEMVEKKKVLLKNFNRDQSKKALLCKVT